MSGTLFIISTPIGNLEDISERAKRIISDADLLLVEDTRVTIKLLNHLGLSKKMVSCHKFNEQSRLDVLAQANAAGQSVALVSDAGTPLISDPGQRIVSEAIALNMNVVGIPGPTAFVQALVGSGLPCDRFVFEGFLPDKDSSLRDKLKQLLHEERTLVFYISPHGLKRTISIIYEVLGDRRVCLARELTKRFEEYIRVRLSELLDSLSEEGLKGEFTLVIEGAPVKTPVPYRPETIREFIEGELKSGVSSKNITAELVRQFGMRKGDAYDLVVSLKNEIADLGI